VDDATRKASEHLADEMRRIIARLAVVRPPADELERAAETAAVFADRLDALPERGQSWEVSEAGLQPGDFVGFSPVSGKSNPMAPPVTLTVRRGSPHADIDTEHYLAGSVTFGPA
jgi:hypothetical protein